MSSRERMERFKLRNPDWRERHRLSCLKWNREHSEIRRLACIEWHKKHPHRYNGNATRTPQQRRAYYYIEKHPELVGFECEFCFSTENLVTHHPSYEYPSIIVTCCSSCHNFIHKGVD